MKKLLLFLVFLSLGYTASAEEKFITTSDGVELFVKIEGTGIPCLYIHGGPGSGSYWFEKFFGDFMEEHFTMIYLDQRGVGRSGSSENGDYSMQRLTQDFEEVRESLGIKNWLTLGHSFGGLLQMGYAENYPQAQNGMMMINATLHLNESFCQSWAPKASEFLGENYVGCKNDTLPLMERMGVLGNKLREKDLFWKMAYANKENQAIMDSTWNEVENWNFDLGNKVWAYEDYWRNFKPNTKEVSIPVLFFYGTKDYMVGPDHYKEVQFPDMILWKSEVGHIPFQENTEDLKKAILFYKNQLSVLNHN
ncbi:alpha/beta fold hydrolase [Christiangramia sediminis]|uniref:Alpha/beta hydrolase n=1 Tax=Christiangramia sediminis TaxID=2881336 RepID=A0A9X1LHJ2_9FLAO|nr:alpha/beta hydrolase [Christiangramia sediminis]MCB7480463.1 alpha/beta hydrolase [Christiangramia sediminis]